MNTTLRFTVRDDSGENFQIAFTRKNDNLTISCTCPEEQINEFCGHRACLMSGETDFIAPDNSDGLLSF